MIRPADMLKLHRTITGISAILLPFTAGGQIDWDGFCQHVARTDAAGLTPAVNMDTGYVNLITEAQRREVLAQTQASLAGKPFVAGAFVADTPADSWNADAYYQQIEQIQARGGIPIIFQSYGLTQQQPDAIVQCYAQLARRCAHFYAFELGPMFAPFGKIYDLETYAGLLEIPQCQGAKHSSLNRQREWQRLVLRDEKRPDFKVFTGNDLAIDMVMYGSDYLLGLSTFAPDWFAQRDVLWQAGDNRFYELNDLLQYLGFFAFRPPVPAYKHSAAQFMRLRGWLECDAPHPQQAPRPASDIAILQDILNRLEALTAA